MALPGSSCPPGGSRRRRATRLVVVVAALAGCDPLSREEFRCEEAMALVLDCCPGVTRSPVACLWTESPISPYVHRFPAVDCIVGQSCAALRERGVCAWAEAGGQGEVCP
jgi:hypothetical protein